MIIVSVLPRQVLNALRMENHRRHPLAEFLPQRGEALGDGIAVVSGLDGPDGSHPARLGHRKVGLSDAQVDRVLELPGEVENLANPGRFELSHPRSDPALGIVSTHGCCPRSWNDQRN